MDSGPTTLPRWLDIVGVKGPRLFERWWATPAVYMWLILVALFLRASVSALVGFSWDGPPGPLMAHALALTMLFPGVILSILVINGRRRWGTVRPVIAPAFRDNGVTVRPRKGHLVAALACAAALWPTALLLFSLLPAQPATAADTARDSALADLSPVAAVLMALAVALSEEIVWRAPLLWVTAAVEGSRSWWWLPGVLCAANAAAFGWTHAQYSALNAVHAGLLGLVGGVLCVRSRSLWPAVLCHAAWDTFAFMVAG